jgi:hypothetical protein
MATKIKITFFLFPPQGDKNKKEKEKREDSPVSF